MWLWVIKKIPFGMLLRLVGQLHVGTALWNLVFTVVSEVQSAHGELSGDQKWALAWAQITIKLKERGIEWSKSKLRWAIEQAVAAVKAGKN